LVVATGGGAFSTDGNRRIIEESGGISVFLELPWDVLQRRLECDNKDRPVYQSAGQARNLLEERLPHYRCATLSFALNGDETPDEIVETVADAVQGMPCGT
ncbi:MAG: shikimate kinase, partial [Acidobacteriota bacterium]|nr:shikimate kinase [Acidobacteriota bacterium]